MRASRIRHAVPALTLFAVVALTAACGKSNIASPTSPSASGSVPSSKGSAVVTGSVSVASFSAPGLQVAVSGYGLSGTVGADGRFQIAQVPAGNLSLQFTGSGINAAVPIGQVADREHVDVDIQLSGNAGSVEASEHITPDDRSEIEGRISAIDNSARSLQVGSRAVSVPASARISSNGTALDFSALKVQQHVHVSGAVQGNSVVASEVEIEDAVEPEPNDNESEFSGSISALGGSCPALSLTVAGKSVATNASTSFDNAACSALAVGVTVEVKGSVQANGSVLASRIHVDDAPGGQPEAETEFIGSIASLGGSCPALAMSVAGKSVNTSASTDFNGVACSALQVGAAIEVKGNVKSDGSVSASRIRLQ